MGRSRDKLDAACERLRAFGAPRLHPADVTSEAQVQQLFEESGPVDHLVCTATTRRRDTMTLAQSRLMKRTTFTRLFNTYP
ncbi:hypothetical protein [Bordetella tumulicola]|uniref:hypothetical protein n=1 Tax=Bordetella tumulicola TaxID=1649133 RepID=UPI0039F05A4B